MRNFSVTFALAIFFLLPLPVTAQTYTDHCINTTSDDVKTYSGFVSLIPDFVSFSGWLSCGDATALSMQGQIASAVYKVSGADTVKVELYTQNGTMATRNSSDSFRLGMNLGDSISNLRRCLYDSNQDIVFVKNDDEIYKLQLTRTYPLFKKYENSVDADSRFYGLNIEVSENGTSFSPLNHVQIAGIIPQDIGGGTYFHETYLTNLPAQTTYVRLMLRAYQEIRGENGLSAQAPENLLLLSRVTFEGANLQVGTPKSESSQPEPESSSSSQEDSTSSSQEESASSSKKSRSNQNNSNSRISMGSNRSRSEHLLFDTYNGDGDNRAAIRAGEEADERGYSHSSAAPNSLEEPAELQPVMVYTELADRVRTQAPLADGDVVAAFAGATGSVSVIAYAIWKLRP